MKTERTATLASCIFAAKTTRPIFLKLGESTGLYLGHPTIFGALAVRTGTCQTKKITYILARPQNEKVEKAASRRSKNIDNEAKSRQIRPLTSS